MNQLRHFIKSDKHGRDKVCPYCDAGDPTSLIRKCNCKRKIKHDTNSHDQAILVAGTPVSLNRP